MRPIRAPLREPYLLLSLPKPEQSMLRKCFCCGNLCCQDSIPLQSFNWIGAIFLWVKSGGPPPSPSTASWLQTTSHLQHLSRQEHLPDQFSSKNLHWTVSVILFIEPYLHCLHQRRSTPLVPKPIHCTFQLILCYCIANPKWATKEVHCHHFWLHRCGELLMQPSFPSMSSMFAVHTLLKGTA